MVIYVGGQANPQVTIRSIVNRGGEQGAQHSNVHSIFAHIPGLRVVMPYSVSDEGFVDGLFLCKDQVIYTMIDGSMMKKIKILK